MNSRKASDKAAGTCSGPATSSNDLRDVEKFISHQVSHEAKVAKAAAAAQLLQCVGATERVHALEILEELYTNIDKETEHIRVLAVATAPSCLGSVATTKIDFGLQGAKATDATSEPALMTPLEVEAMNQWADHLNREAHFLRLQGREHHLLLIKCKENADIAQASNRAAVAVEVLQGAVQQFLLNPTM